MTSNAREKGVIFKKAQSQVEMCASEKNNVWQNCVIKTSVCLELFIIFCLFTLNENVLEMWSWNSLLVKSKNQHNINWQKGI